MQKFLVGGAVRDTLLNLPITERDWVIVGSTPKEMLKIGFTQVGKEFPVFLHPENHEEYALARTERKSGQGYTGFTCYVEPSITIKEDLYRRDLTINAMAYDLNGNLIDPYNGLRDIKLRLLRHVSNRFYEDPLRVLRVARFAARFANLHFTVAPETLTLMKKMNHELLSISPERIWSETKKALTTENPQIYFQILHKCGALKILFPEFNKLFQLSTPCKNNINTNIYNDTMNNLAYIANLTHDLSVRFAVLCKNLNKKITINNIQEVKNKNNHNNNKSTVDHLCSRLKIPNNICNFAKIVFKYRSYICNITKLSSKKLIILLDAFNCWKIPKRIEQINLINKSNTLKYKHHEKTEKNTSSNHSEKFLYTAFMIAKSINIKDIIADGFTGYKIRKELYNRRLHALNTWKNKNN